MPRSITHQVAILTLGRIIAYAVMFVVPIVNVRALSVEEYGYYRQFWLILETVMPALVLGFPRSLLYHLPRADTSEEKSIYVSQTVLLLTIASCVGAVIYATMAAQFGEGLGAAARAFYWRLTFLTFFMVVTDIMEVLFVARGQTGAQSVYHAVTSGLQAVCVMVASYLSRDVSTVIWAVSIFGLARFIFGISYMHAAFRLRLRGITWRSIREQLSFAAPLGFSAIAYVLLSQTDKFIINRYMGREEFAIYAVGAFQVPLLNIVGLSISNVTFPMMVQYQKSGDHQAMLGLWQRSLLKMVLLFFPAFVFLVVSARPFVTVLFTEQYASATPVFLAYMFLFLRSAVDTTPIIQAYKRTGFIFGGYAAGLVLNILLGLLFFRVAGRIGVPLATVVTMNLLNAAFIGYSARLMGARFLDLFPVVRLAARMLAAAVPGAALAALYAVYPVDSPVELAVAGLSYGLLYVIVCLVTRLVTVHDLRSMLGRGSV